VSSREVHARSMPPSATPALAALAGLRTRKWTYPPIRLPVLVAQWLDGSVYLAYRCGDSAGLILFADFTGFPFNLLR
jgi:hypothetical protein